MFKRRWDGSKWIKIDDKLIKMDKHVWKCMTADEMDKNVWNGWVTKCYLMICTSLSGHKTLSRDNKLSCHKRSEICQRNFKRFWNTPQFRGFLDFLPTFFCIYTYVFKIAQQIRLTLKISFPTYICINDTSSSGEWHFTAHLPGFNNGVYKSEEGQKKTAWKFL